MVADEDMVVAPEDSTSTGTAGEGERALDEGETASLAAAPLHEQEEAKDQERRKKEFPWKLHVMLDDASKEDKGHIVSWNHDGKSFKVHNPIAFMSEVAPRYFNHKHYRSFQKMVSDMIMLRLHIIPRHHSTSRFAWIRSQKTPSLLNRLELVLVSVVCYRSTRSSLGQTLTNTMLPLLESYFVLLVIFGNHCNRGQEIACDQTVENKLTILYVWWFLASDCCYRLSSLLFVRRVHGKLNLYDFQKVMGGSDRGGYTHHLFQKDRRELCHNLRIRTTRSTLPTRKARSPRTSPTSLGTSKEATTAADHAPSSLSCEFISSSFFM